MSSNYRSLVWCLTVIFALVLPAKARFILEVPGGQIVGGNFATGNYGWEFEVTAPVQVAGLAFWDEAQDGFLEEHTVGLRTKSGSLLASATFAPGLSASLLGEFRTQGIAPLTLSAG